MIIARHRDAAKLSSTMTLKSNTLYFSNIIDRAKVVDIIYFDKKINIVQMRNKFGPTMATIGELEKKNLPFILLIDKKSEINISSYCTTVINADCISYDTLEPYFPERGKLTKKDRKGFLVNDLFVEFTEYNHKNSGNFRDSFNCFVRSHEVDELLTTDVLFLAMDAETGSIHNSNGHLGKFYDEAKVWYFGEEYNYDEEEVDMIEVVSGISIIDEFTWMYETQKSPFTMNKLKGLTQEQLTEIITKYPNLFTDLLKRRHSWYLPSKIVQYEDMFEEPKEDTEPKVDFMLSDSVRNVTAEKCLEDYYEMQEGTEKDMNVCFSCENYVFEDQSVRSSVEGKLVDLCLDCEAAFPVRASGF